MGEPGTETLNELVENLLFNPLEQAQKILEQNKLFSLKPGKSFEKVLGIVREIGIDKGDEWKHFGKVRDVLEGVLDYAG